MTAHQPDRPEAPDHPPTANRSEDVRTFHGDAVADPYAWMADVDSPELYAYLEAENGWTEQATTHLAELRDALFSEVSARTKQTDTSVPSRFGDHWYYTRTVEGLQYPIHCRVPAQNRDLPPTLPEDGSGLAGEQVLLDENQAAGESDFFALGTFDVSADGNWLAYSVDVVGDERYTLKVRDLRTGDDLPGTAEQVSAGSAWAADNATVFYLVADEAWRPHQVWRRNFAAGDDAVLVFTEDDDRYWLGVAATRNDRAILIDAASKQTTETWLVPADAPATEPVVIAPRREGVEYSVEHDGDRLLIVHNRVDPNFTIATAPLDAPGRWTELFDPEPARRVLGVDAFEGFATVVSRIDGLTALQVLRRDPDSPTGFAAPVDVGFDEPIYTVEPGSNPSWDQTAYRFEYESMATRPSVYDLDLSTGERRLLKQLTVLTAIADLPLTQYREWATAADGTRVPISIVARADLDRSQPAPTVLYGYGAYEISIDPTYSITRLSLLERGVVFAIAHIRGGGELGRPWYENGRLHHKRNSFTDFTDCARHLIHTGWTTPDRLVAHGGSAGGLLMGAVANLAPELFAGVFAAVPFVDALTSILNPELPLTVTEWDEWGDPLHDPQAYAYIKGYSPYDNVTRRDYPPILAITGLHDTRVLVTEPAKWVAAIRHANDGAPGVLLRTELSAGHGGRSGRYDAWREWAYHTAWQLDVLNCSDPNHSEPSQRHDS